MAAALLDPVVGRDVLVDRRDVEGGALGLDERLSECFEDVRDLLRDSV